MGSCVPTTLWSAQNGRESGPLQPRSRGMDGAKVMTLPNGNGSDASVLHLDAAGVPRGGAAECACYQPPKPRPLTFERARPSAGVAEPPAVCQRCGCLGEEHRELQRWYDVATRWIERMGIQRRPTRGLPAEAQHWEPQVAVLWAIAGRSFDLGPFGNPAEQDDYNEGPHLVSALCVTSQGRQAFHPLLYENFRRQSYEAKELIIIDSGAEPSAFMLERKAEDARVFYYFFKAESLSPGSPRLPEEEMDAICSSVLRADDPMECTEWTRKRPFATEVKKEGWTKGFKRNLACMMARGSTLVNLEDGCLYAEDYLDTMRKELLAVNHSPSEAAAVALQMWHTVALANQTFRWVDLGVRDPQLPEALPKADRWAHGFAHAYTRAAWLKQPFPDKEGPQDMRFMEALQSQRIKVALATSDVAKAACGWCLPQPAAKDAATSVNMYSELLLLAGRGQPDVGAAWSPLLPMVEAAVEVFTAKSAGRLKRIVENEGTVYVCSSCDSAVALQKHWRDTSTHTSPYGCTFDIGQFSRAGGAVAEANDDNGYEVALYPGVLHSLHLPLGGSSSLGREYDDGTTWFPGWIWRESRSWNRSGGRGDASLFWGLIWRHLRQHGASGNTTTGRAQLRCPKDHVLRRYATPHAHYVCDVCNRQVKTGEHLWGCGACDYDMCDGCKAKAVHRPLKPPEVPAGVAESSASKTRAGDASLALSAVESALPALLKPIFPMAQWQLSYAMYWP